jgi:hypothetical protein
MICKVCPWVVALLLGGAGCSADEAPIPEPTFSTPGAFLAVRNGPRDYTLARTLDRLPLGASTGSELIVITRYAPVVPSLEEARTLAQSSAIPIQDPAFVIPLSELENGKWEVVWFRSLTEQEKEPL